jgi:hypothetical protein
MDIFLDYRPSSDSMRSSNRLDVASCRSRQRERRHRAFHALEHVHAQQVDQAFFAVGLAEEAFAAADLVLYFSS